ncbi:hypothetical protein RJ639_031825 [Escallonia herrerae]|uniref:Leucine-rich repeat-containing protein 40 n=1 Tax=Escallonia herrerae TaxID=1293975 RepID=A0AA89BC79_9ASTE|nr:hypothetical protein RJ639_031825 [Escallonia herrerae]
MDRVLKAARSSGSLNLSNRSLKEVPDEVYKSLDAVGEGENWWEAVELQKLILAHNTIESLKDDLRNLPMLSVLNVSHNKLSRLPSAIGELHMLKSLDVSSNLIHDIPQEIGSATSLVKFDCSNNQLKDLPSSLGRCLQLSDLKGNKLNTIPEHMIASWTMLTELTAGENSHNCFNTFAAKNYLNGIPETIGNLSHLIRLDLCQNRILSIPSSIEGCTSLVEFYMGNNALSSLPAEIGALHHLGTFDLHSNQLKEYPVAACKLHLTVLDLSNNSLTGLPPEIGLMTTLRKLLLNGNPLRTLRSALVSGPTPALLKYLRSRLPVDEESGATSATKEDAIAMATRLSLSSKELSLEGLGLSTVPSEAWKSGEITKIDLSRNAIEELPVELFSCLSLEALILSRNKIKVWPSAILQSLSNLSCLKLDNNLLQQIPPDGFQAASKLQILDLSGNAGSIPECPAYSSLPQLQELYLRRVKISKVPTDIFSLQDLRILDLSQNSLQLIPECEYSADCWGFTNLTSLRELDLSDNNITALPPELVNTKPFLIYEYFFSCGIS